MKETFPDQVHAILRALVLHARHDDVALVERLARLAKSVGDAEQWFHVCLGEEDRWAVQPILEVFEEIKREHGDPGPNAYP